MSEVNAIKVPSSYDGPHLTFPLTRNQVVNMYKAFRARKRLHAKYVMQLLEEFYLHADGDFRTMMESTIEEGTTMTICGDTHGQWEDFCTIMDMNGLPSESNRVRVRWVQARAVGVWLFHGGPDLSVDVWGVVTLVMMASQYLYNGDFVDRGPCGVEITLLLFAFNLADPTCMMINRGNHECYPQNFQYGFVDEVLTKYPAEWREKIFWGFQVRCALPWCTVSRASLLRFALSSPAVLCDYTLFWFVRDKFNLPQRAFKALPLCTVLSGRVFVCHGGLFRSHGVTLNQIQAVDVRCARGCARYRPLELTSCACATPAST